MPRPRSGAAALLALAVLARPESALAPRPRLGGGTLVAAPRRRSSRWRSPSSSAPGSRSIWPRPAAACRPRRPPRSRAGWSACFRRARGAAGHASCCGPGAFAVEWVKWLGSVNALLPFMIPPGLWLLWRPRRPRGSLLPAPRSSFIRSRWRCSRRTADPASRRDATRYSSCRWRRRSPAAAGRSRAWGAASSAPPSVAAAPARLRRRPRGRRAGRPLARGHPVWLGGPEHRGHAGAPRALGGREHAADARLALNDVGAIALSLAPRGRGRDGPGDAGHLPLSAGR